MPDNQPTPPNGIMPDWLSRNPLPAAAVANLRRLVCAGGVPNLIWPPPGSVTDYPAAHLIYASAAADSLILARAVDARLVRPSEVPAVPASMTLRGSARTRIVRDDPREVWLSVGGGAGYLYGRGAVQAAGNGDARTWFVFDAGYPAPAVDPRPGAPVAAAAVVPAVPAGCLVADPIPHRALMNPGALDMLRAAVGTARRIPLSDLEGTDPAGDPIGYRCTVYVENGPGTYSVPDARIEIRPDSLVVDTPHRASLVAFRPVELWAVGADGTTYIHARVAYTCCTGMGEVHYRLTEATRRVRLSPAVPFTPDAAPAAPPDPAAPADPRERAYRAGPGGVITGPGVREPVTATLAPMPRKAYRITMAAQTRESARRLKAYLTQTGRRMELQLKDAAGRWQTVVFARLRNVALSGMVVTLIGTRSAGAVPAAAGHPDAARACVKCGAACPGDCRLQYVRGPKGDRTTASFYLCVPCYAAAVAVAVDDATGRARRAARAVTDFAEVI